MNKQSRRSLGESLSGNDTFWEEFGITRGNGVDDFRSRNLEESKTKRLAKVFMSLYSVPCVFGTIENKRGFVASPKID
jgi:hypothetical protein